MKVTFLNEPRLATFGNGNEWTLVEDFYVSIDSEDGDTPVNFAIPAGFSTDLASVPRLPLMHMLFSGRARRSAILHDWLYVMQYPRKWADDAFKAAMANEDVGPLSRWLMWAGVRLGGSIYYDAHQIRPEADKNADQYDPR